MRALDAAQIDADLALELGVDRLGEVMPHQHVFGRDGGVGLELEDPVAVRLLPLEQRAGRGLDVLFQSAVVSVLVIQCDRLVVDLALSDELGGAVAGSNGTFDGGRQAGIGPIAGQEKIARSACAAPGRRASCSGVAAKVARRSRTICQGGNSGGRPVIAATSLQIVCASASRGVSISRSAALIVTESGPGRRRSIRSWR